MCVETGCPIEGGLVSGLKLGGCVTGRVLEDVLFFGCSAQLEVKSNNPINIARVMVMN
jgi:hypothetical protein